MVGTSSPGFLPAVRLDERVVAAGWRGLRSAGWLFLRSAIQPYERAIFVELGHLRVLVFAEAVRLTALQWLLLAVQRAATPTDVWPSATNTRQ